MNPSTLKYTTRCRAKKADGSTCGFEFQGSPFDPPIIGQPSERFEKAVKKMMDHISNDHPELMQMGAMGLESYMRFMVMYVFHFEDPQLIEAYHNVRRPIHQQTKGAVITDEQIAARVRDLGLPPEVEEGIDTLIRDMRDLLTESGRYAPQQQTEKPLVTV